MYIHEVRSNDQLKLLSMYFLEFCYLKRKRGKKRRRQKEEGEKEEVGISKRDKMKR